MKQRHQEDCYYCEWRMSENEGGALQLQDNKEETWEGKENSVTLTP